MSKSVLTSTSPPTARTPCKQAWWPILVQRAFAGSAKALVVAALKSGSVNAQERAEIRALLGQEDAQ